MGKGFFLVSAAAWGALQMFAILAGAKADLPIVMFMVSLGIFSIMKLVEERAA